MVSIYSHDGVSWERGTRWRLSTPTRWYTVNPKTNPSPPSPDQQTHRGPLLRVPAPYEFPLTVAAPYMMFTPEYTIPQIRGVDGF